MIKNGYASEKKKVFYIEALSESTNTVSFYRMTFKECISSKEFFRVMDKARESENKYADLFDASFRRDNGIENIELMRTDISIRVRA